MSGRGSGRPAAERRGGRSGYGPVRTITDGKPPGRYITRWAAWSVIAAAFCVSAGAVVMRGGALEWFAAALLAGIGLTSGLLPAVAAIGLKAERKLGAEVAEAGQKVWAAVKVKRKWTIPFVWVAVQDEADNVTRACPSPVRFGGVTLPMTDKETSAAYPLGPFRRGLYEFGPVTVTVGDWLGLTAIRRKSGSRAELAVLPAIQDGGTAREQRLRITADAGGEDTGGHGADPGSGAERRLYREGDSIRSIDFRTAARGLGLYTKLRPNGHVPERTVIAIDTYGKPYGADGRLFDSCIGFALSVAVRCGKSGGAVTVAAGDWTYELCKGGEGVTEARLSELLHLAAGLRTDDSGVKAEAFAHEETAVGQGVSVRVFTGDWQAGRRWEELADGLLEAGSSLELIAVTESAVPSFAMRERHNVLESQGIRTSWIYTGGGDAGASGLREGADFYAIG